MKQLCVEPETHQTLLRLKRDTGVNVYTLVRKAVELLEISLLEDSKNTVVPSVLLKIKEKVGHATTENQSV